MKKLTFTISVLFFCLSFAQVSHAQLLMEKSRIEETVEPGDTLTDTMSLHNRSDSPMPLTIYWEDFEYQPPFEGQKAFMPPGTSEYSMANWIAFSPQEATIPPQGSVNINFTIKVPKSASGGYYGVLFFESGSRKRMDTTGVNIVTRLGSLFFIEVTDKDKRSHVKDLKLNANVLEGVFVNKGNVILFPKGIYYIMDQEGLVVEREELEKIYLPPEMEANFSIPLSEDLSAGEYTLVLTFDLNEGYSVVKEIDFKKKSDLTYTILKQRD